MPFVNFRKNSFPSIFARISMIELSAVTEHTRNKIFFMTYPKKIFSSKSSLWFYYCRWFPRRFLKILIIYSKNLHFSLVFLSIFQNL